MKVYADTIQEFPQVQRSADRVVQLTAPNTATVDRYFTLDATMRRRWQYQTNTWNLTRIVPENGAYERTLSLNYRGRICVLSLGGRCLNYQNYFVEICAGPNAVPILGNDDHNFIFCLSSTGEAVNQGLRLGVTEHNDWSFEIFTHVPAD